MNKVDRVHFKEAVYCVQFVLYKKADCIKAPVSDIGSIEDYSIAIWSADEVLRRSAEFRLSSSEKRADFLWYQ